MKIAMHYDDDAYVESVDRGDQRTGGVQGLWGRHVAGREFLDAYLTHGVWDELVALVRNRPSRKSIVRFCEQHPSSVSKRRRLRIFSERDFHGEFLPDPPADLLYTPQPPDERYAWARQHANPYGFAICGVTHTLCSARAVRWLISMVTAPFDEFDALICTSRSVVQMVRAVTDSYCDFLRDRYGGSPRLNVRLEQIPLGVNTAKYRPPTAEERAERRAQLQIAEDEVVFLFVGRLAAHAKAHPFPIYHGLQEAVRRTRKKVHLVLSGWAKTPKIMQAFVDGAATFAPDVRLTVVDGTSAEMRLGVWQAADVFVSLSDNLQETFGLVIVEAMACGLPVVATDWDGYRDLIVHDESGLLVPTSMFTGATADSTARLLMGQTSYDRFLGECNQAIVVDNQATADIFTRLVEEPQLRARLGIEARRRALEVFDWSHIVRAYESLWQDQQQQLRDHAVRTSQARKPKRGPSMYPAPETSFAGYPTEWVDGSRTLTATPNAERLLAKLLREPLTNYAADRRTDDPDLLRLLLQAAQSGKHVDDLKALLIQQDCDEQMALATLAWATKYGLLQVDGTFDAGS